MYQQRFFKFFRAFGMILVGMFSSTVLYDTVANVIQDGFPEHAQLALPTWAALSIWLTNYSWGCLTEWMWYRYLPMQGFRCVLEWMLSMVGNLLWPPALGVMTFFWFERFSNLPSGFGDTVAMLLGVGCLLFNFFYPQRLLERMRQGTYKLS